MLTAAAADSLRRSKAAVRDVGGFKKVSALQEPNEDAPREGQWRRLAAPRMLTPDYPFFVLPEDVGDKGWTVRVSLTPTSTAGYTVNFFPGSPVDANTILFLWNVRYSSTVVVRNSLFNGLWGGEERGGGLPVAFPNRHEVRFQYTATNYAVWINGVRQSAFDYAHRNASKVTAIGIAGATDAMVEVLTYQPTEICSRNFGTSGYFATTLPEGVQVQTVEAFVKITGSTNLGTPFVGNRYSTDKVWGLYLNPGGIYSAQSGGPTWPYNGTNPTDGSWHHVALAGSTMYIDGKQMATGVSNYLSQNSYVGIGFYPYKFTGYGSIQYRELRLWSTVRTQEEIAGNMSSVRNDAPGLLTYLPWSKRAPVVGDYMMVLYSNGGTYAATIANISVDSEGAPVYTVDWDDGDESDRDHPLSDLQWFPQTMDLAPAAQTSGLTWTNATTSILCEAASELYTKPQASLNRCGANLGTTGYMNTTAISGVQTVESWVMITGTGGVGTPWIGNEFFTDKKWGLYVNAGGIYSAEAGGPSWSYAQAATTGLRQTNAADGAWHHVALVGNTMYLDGLLFATGVSNYIDRDTILWIGNWPNRFSGQGSIIVRDFRIWSVARTAAQILTYKDSVISNSTGLITRLMFEQNMGDSSSARRTWVATGMKYACDYPIWTRWAHCFGIASTNRLDWSQATIKSLASTATRVRICTKDSQTDCMTSTADSFPVKMLAKGQQISGHDGVPCDSSCTPSIWSGPRLGVMWNQCSGLGNALDGTVLIYHACNNGGGMHVSLANGSNCGWVNGANDNLEFYVDAEVPFAEYSAVPSTYLSGFAGSSDTRELASAKAACTLMGAACGGVTCPDGLGRLCTLRAAAVTSPSSTGEYSYVKLTTATTTITITSTTATTTISTTTTRTTSTSTLSTTTSSTTTATTSTTSSTTFRESIATMVSGRIGMYTASPDAFVNNTNATFAMTVMLANTVGTDSIFVRIQLVKVAATPARRLSGSGPSRRLQTANVNMQYNILAPANPSTSPTVDSLMATMSTVQVSTLQTSANAALTTYTGGRFSVTVTGVDPPFIILPSTTSTTTSSQTTTFTITKFVTVTKSTTTTTTLSTTTVTTTTRTTTTAVPGAPTETSTTITMTTSTTTMTPPPPPAAVAAPAAPCSDSATYVDAKGLKCEDWKGLDCNNAPGYTEKVLAGIRKKCAAACGTCKVAAPFVVQEVKKVSSELALGVDLTQLDQDTRASAMKACVSAALGVPLTNVVGIEVEVAKSRRLQGDSPQYKVKYQVVVPPSMQVRDIMLQATSLSVPGSQSLAAFSQVMSDGFGVDTSTLAVEVTVKPVAEPVAVFLDGDNVVGTTAPAPAPNATSSSGGSIVVDNCFDDGAFLDEQGEGCSGWVGLDCSSTKWLRSERPYTLKGLKQVLTSCPLSCGKCSPPTRMTFDQLNESCIDDPLVAGWCARWRNINCSSAVDLGYSKSYAALLLDRCPQSCGMCPVSAVACVDALAFKDEQGQPCASWKGYSCTKEYGGYTRKGMLEVQAACPDSCGFCGTQAGRSLALVQQPDQCTDNADFTYLQQFTCRDFVGRQCTYGTLYLEPRWLLGPRAVTDWHDSLWKACPVSCTRCDPQGRPTPLDLFIECEDDEYIAEWCAVKWKGQDCSQWDKLVRLVVDGEGSKYNSTLLGRCPQTCGLCTKPSCGDGTYRNKVAHECHACQLGRYAKGIRSGVDAECRPAEPGFSVPEEGATEQYPCDRGQFTNVSGQAECANCSAGYYSASRGMSSCVPCAEGWYQDEPGASECLRCVEGTYAPMNGTAQCESCPFDYTTLLQASTAIDDCVCPPGTYKPYNTTGGCVDCPIAIDCPGGHQFVNQSWDATPLLMAGVMSLWEDPFSAYTCTAADACLDERPVPQNEDAMYAVCPDLTWGPRCWNCPNNGTGAFHDDDGLCQPCDNMGRRIVGVIGFFVLQFAGTWWAYRSEGTVVTAAKLMFMAGIGFLQVLATLTQIPLVWPWDMAWLLTFLNWFNYDGFLSDIFQFHTECFFAPTLLARVLRDVFLPLLPFINFAVIGGFYYLIKREMVWSCAKNVMASMWFGFFVNLSVMALQLFPAEQMPNGKLYLLAYPGVEVGSQEWKTGVPISIVAIVVYCCTFLTYTIHAVIMAPSKQEDEEWLESRDFMLGETDPTCFWWCLVDLFYAFCIAVVQALSPNIYFNLYLSLAVLLAYIMMLIYYQPCVYKLANHVNVTLNVGMLIFTALAMGLIDVTLVDQSENRADFGVILITLLIILLVWIFLRICYALYERCTVNQLELNVEEAHRARIVVQSLILLPEQEFIQSLSDVWDPEVHIWQLCNKMLIPIFFQQQAGSQFALQRLVAGREFKVFHHDECRMQALGNSEKGEVAQRLEEYCRLTKLTNTVATKVLRPIEKNTTTSDGVVQIPGPIITHAANRIESSRLAQDFLVKVLPEVPSAYMTNPEQGGEDAEANTSLASKALVKTLTRLERGKSERGKRFAQKSRNVLHECGATLVDEDAFVQELLHLVELPEPELREVYKHLDVNRQGQLKASHIVTQLKLLGDIPRDYDEAQAEEIERSQALGGEAHEGHDEHEGHEAGHDTEGHTSHFKKGSGKGKYGHHHVHHHHLSGEHHESEGSHQASHDGGHHPGSHHDAAGAATPGSRASDNETVHDVDTFDHLQIRDAVHRPARAMVCSFPKGATSAGELTTPEMDDKEDAPSSTLLAKGIQASADPEGVVKLGGASST